MKTKVILACLVVLLTTTGFECINDPLIVSINADPISGCVAINTGSGSFNSSVTFANLRSIIPSDFADSFTGLRIYDVRVSVTHPHPSGVVSGSVWITLSGGSEQKLLDFSGEYETFSQGVSLVNSGGLITYNKTVLLTLFSNITSVNAIPASAVIRAAGTGPAVTQSFNLCVDVYVQVDAAAND